MGSPPPGSALPRSALPGSAPLPGSALPGSALPGSALPGSALSRPGSGQPSANAAAGMGGGNGVPRASRMAPDVPVSTPRARSRPSANRGAENSGSDTPAPGSAAPGPEGFACRGLPAAGGGVRRDQRGRQVHLGGGTPVRRLLQRHRDAVPRRQVRDREQAHMPGDRGVRGGGWASCQLSCPAAPRACPVRASVMLISEPPPRAVCPDTMTWVVLGENVVAFSSSSASRCTVSGTALPLTETPCWTSSTTRPYCSISDTAARSTSTRVTGAVRVAASRGPRGRARCLSCAASGWPDDPSGTGWPAVPGHPHSVPGCRSAAAAVPAGHGCAGRNWRTRH